MSCQAVGHTPGPPPPVGSPRRVGRGNAHTLRDRISVGGASREVPHAVLDTDVQSPAGETCELILLGTPSIWGSTKASALNTHGKDSALRSC